MYPDSSQERNATDAESRAPEPPPVAAPPPRTAPRTLVVWAITAINVAVWLALEASGGSTTTRTLVLFGAKVNTFIADGQYWRLLSAIFIHIGPIHLIVNSVSLFFVGRLAEVIFGHWRFLAIYLVAGVASLTFSYLLNPGLAAGASGAIFGVAGALAVFFLVNRSARPIAGQGQLGSIVVQLAINGIFGVATQVVDNWGHLGGLIAGAVLAAYLTPRFEPVTTPEGYRSGWRLRRSSVASWAIVPVVLAILVVAVLRIPPR
jgi:rhomboid protease GluP